MSGDSITHGKQRDQPQDKSIKMLEEPRPPQAPQTMDVASASTSGSQCWSMDGIQQKQLRPSVLCQLSQTASRQQQAASICKDELDADHPTQSSSPHVGPPPRHHYLFPLRAESPKQSSSEAERHDGVSGKISASFVSGLCRWPGCDVVSEDFSSYLKHLRSEHRHSDRSLAQWKVQQDIVHCMENQNPASAWPPCLPLVLPPPAGRAPAWSMKHLDQLSQQGHQAAASVHLLPGTTLRKGISMVLFVWENECRYIQLFKRQLWAYFKLVLCPVHFYIKPFHAFSPRLSAGRAPVTLPVLVRCHPALLSWVHPEGTTVTRRMENTHGDLPHVHSLLLLWPILTMRGMICLVRGIIRVGQSEE
ncbi:uncharacterized protein [Antennarius striatus]|uniref:uncharacterized protein isoform X3 n=1 Tax=Antennarius striatus TaxID=241820 RepID=UPI0035B3BA7C